MNFITLGLMSGTSVDAIDASLVLTKNDKDKLLLHMQHPYSPALREKILGLIRSPSMNLPDFTQLHYEIGEAFAAAAEKTLKAAKQKRLLKSSVLSIGSHGQTVFHDPEGKRTLQIGEGALVAARTGITTVSDFRVADTALGGDGAPLLPFYHQRLFAKEAKKGIVVHNLGGISNFTYMNGKEIFALDTGPANCLIDGVIQKITGGKLTFDNNGNIARAGKLLPDLMHFLKEKPDIAAFREKRAPKSTGRELFSPKLLELAMAEYHAPIEDLLFTLTQFTCDLIVESYEREIGKKPLKKIVFAGGGAKNSFLLELLRKNFSRSVEFATMEDCGWSSQSLESQAFGLFSAMALRGLPITFPKTTGTKTPAVCGKINPGKNWKKIGRL